MFRGGGDGVLGVFEFLPILEKQDDIPLLKMKNTTTITMLNAEAHRFFLGWGGSEGVGRVVGADRQV